MNTDLPGTQYSRMLQRQEARNEFALNPAVVHAFDNYERNIRGSKFGEAVNNLRVMAEHTSDRQLQLYYLTLAEQLYGQMVAQTSLNLMPQLPQIPASESGRGSGSRNRDKTPPTYSRLSITDLPAEFDRSQQELYTLMKSSIQNGIPSALAASYQNAFNAINVSGEQLFGLHGINTNLMNLNSTLRNQTLELQAAQKQWNSLTAEQQASDTVVKARLNTAKLNIQTTKREISDQQRLAQVQQRRIELNKNIISIYNQLKDGQLSLIQNEIRLARTEAQRITKTQAYRQALILRLSEYETQLQLLQQTNGQLEQQLRLQGLITETKSKIKSLEVEPPKFDWLNQLSNLISPIISAFDSLGNAIGNVLVKGANFGKQMKDVWTNMTASILANLTAMIAKLGIMLLLQSLIPGLGSGTLGGLFGFGGLTNGSTIWSQLFPKDLPKSNSKSRITSNSIIPNMNNSLAIKLDRIGNLLQNFTPINTQVIDLPTLAKANSIGNAMLVGSI